jgi:hypothetical protein
MTDKIEDHDEVMFRQVHPDFIQQGEPSSCRFRPQSNDEGKLSVDRESLTTASRSHALYTSTGKLSAAVYGLSVGEFGNHDVTVHPDPTEATETHPANEAHALADFGKHSPSKQKTIGKRLKRDALARGRLHP